MAEGQAKYCTYQCVVDAEGDAASAHMGGAEGLGPF